MFSGISFIDGMLYALFLLICFIAVNKLYASLSVYRQIILARHTKAIIADSAADLLADARSKLSLLYVAAQVSPFIGLTGTVLRIQEALTTLTPTSGLTEIAHPVGAALHSTFLGLACAILAVVSYGLANAWVGKLHRLLATLPQYSGGACAKE